MELELKKIIKEFGFKRDYDLEEHPTEAYSYEMFYTASALNKGQVAQVLVRLKRVHRNYEVSMEQGHLRLENRAAYPAPEVKRRTDLCDTVEFFADVPSGHDPNQNPECPAMIRIFRSIYYPEEVTNER